MIDLVTYCFKSSKKLNVHFKYSCLLSYMVCEDSVATHILTTNGMKKITKIDVEYIAIIVIALIALVVSVITV